MEKVVILREDACGKLGLKHPAYIVMEKLSEVKARGGGGVLVETDDFDWALTIKAVAQGAGFKVQEEREGGRIRLLITA